MTMIRRAVARCLVAAAGVTMLAPLAQAQDQAGEQSRAGGLEEIIVTAQKRVESAQDVPIALSVFDDDVLQNANIDRIEDIALRTPNFTMMRTNVGEPQFYIRGVGSNSDSAAGDPTVGVFQDEIYIGRVSGAAFDVFDMQRVEVLRGPQGTLYGRNTSGGAVNFVPKRPEPGTFASAELSYGNYDTLEGRAVLNGGSETLAGRLSVSHREHDGYSENITSGDELDDEDNWSARGQLLFQPGEGNRLLLAYDFVQDDAAGNARVPFPVFDTGQVGAGNNAALVALRAIWPKGSDLRKSYSDPDSYQEREINGLTVRYEHDASYGTWTLLGGWREVELNWYEDLDGLKPYGTPPIPPVFSPPYGWVLRNRDVADEDAEQYSVEMRLGSAQDSKVKWVAGLYWFTETVRRDESFDTQFSLAAVAGGDVTFIQDVDSDTYAAFGQLTYPFTDAFSVTAGLRYSNDEKSARQAAINNDPLDAVPGIPLFPGQPYDVRAEDSWDSTTGKLGVDWRVGADHLVYASVSKGFKSGIFPSQNNVSTSVGEATPPEEVWSYEIGAKTQWLDNRLRVNAAAFYMDYTDLQLFRLDSALRLVTFTEDTQNSGLELDVVAAPLDGLELGLSAAYLSAEVDGGSNDGGELPRSPEYTVGGYVQYSAPIGANAFTLRVGAKWTDDFRTEIPYNTGNAAADEANWRITEVESFTLVDARAAFAWTEHNLEFAVWGKNLTDEEYPMHIIPFLGNGFSIFGAPRTYGVSVAWKSR
ncbi:MAG TPA: TonB-dependent receptor [Steroidobacteraceae bacterium]|nr:TonB-dependent receptor [Steroidobacteraceae bacterium]